MSKKGENIYKRKDNRWEGRYIRFYQPDGSPKYGYCYGKTYREAREKLSRAKVNLHVPVPTHNDASRKRFGIYCDEWLRVNRSRVKESTYVKYSAILEKHIKPRLGGFRLQALSTPAAEQFGHDLLYEEELSPKTVKDILTVLHSIVKYTAKQVSLPPIEIIYPKVPKTETRVLSREEQTLFVKNLLQDTDAYKFGILLALLTGMRIGEVCALRWENVSLEQKTVTVCATMQRLRNLTPDSGQKTKLLISDPKSKHSARVIPLTDYTVELCKRYRCDIPGAFVLTGEENRCIEPRLMQYRLERITKQCGLDGVHFHTLRHTFATRCVEVDFEIKSLSEILGHSSPKITLERYVHSSLELKRDNMNKLTAIGL